MSDEYISPLVSRMRDAEPLSLDTLSRYVPLVHAGREAEERLASGVLSIDEKRQALRTRHESERAKEKLVLIGLPLVKSLAFKEFRRRQAWNSRVPLEEIIQEGMAGFLKGINAYNPTGTHTSPTNYLGQWVLTEIRRNVEGLEHDFTVPYETIERHRKIRAIRSRLAGELGREPTDEEIVEGAAASAGLYGDSKIGRVDKTRVVPEGTDRRRVITVRHIEEERDASARTGMMRSTSPSEDSDESDIAPGSGEVVTAEGGASTINSAAEMRSVRKGLSSLIEGALDALSAGAVQREIIERKFGLSPYEEEQSLKDICAFTSVPRHKVNRVLLAFNTAMSTPGGPFHALLSRLPLEDVESMELTWLVNLLGDWKGASGAYVPSPDLTMPLRRSTSTKPRRTLSTPSYGVVATFECPYHVTAFTSTYASEDEIPLSKYCPQCGRTSPRVV